jgi:hypothetical protein
MARHLKHPELGCLGALDPGDAPRQRARSEKRPSRRPNPGALARAQAAAEWGIGQWEKGKRDVFDDADPRLIVGLYSALHEMVYGVAPDELARDWSPAVGAATRMLDHEFSGDAKLMVRYVRWTWTREKDREKWRAEHGAAGGRIGWRLQFQSLALLTDYKVAVARRVMNGRAK